MAEIEDLAERLAEAREEVLAARKAVDLANDETVRREREKLLKMCEASAEQLQQMRAG